MFEINKKKIGTEYPPYIIAELSANHGGSVMRAKKSIKAAKDAGASAVKIQTYTPDTMTIDSNKPDFQIKDGLWRDTSLYKLYGEAYTPYEWHPELFSFAKELEITIFSTPFDETAVELLENLNTPAYKIASFELVDLPLIELVAKQKKPLFISTGMSSLDEIGEALEVAKKYGNGDILLFHCISSYPATTEEANLNNITYLAREFQTEVGLSDHTHNHVAALAAVALGASAIEKHFKLDEKDCGPDSSFSLLPSELKETIEACNLAWKAMGKSNFSRSLNEEKNKIFRRSIYFVKDLKKGSKVSESDIKRIRPGFGLEPKYFHDIIGKILSKDVQRGEPVTWDSFI